jgi:hypothetical protein
MSKWSLEQRRNDCEQGCVVICEHNTTNGLVVVVVHRGVYKLLHYTCTNQHWTLKYNIQHHSIDVFLDKIVKHSSEDCIQVIACYLQKQYAML